MSPGSDKTASDKPGVIQTVSSIKPPKVGTPITGLKKKKKKKKNLSLFSASE